jgi:hypothetical protein
MKLEDLKAEKRALELQDFINSCSDDFYYSNGGKAAMDREIAKVQAAIAALEAVSQ